jgi:hypothetical protein
VSVFVSVCVYVCVCVCVYVRIEDRWVRRGRLLLSSCLSAERGCQKGVRRQRDNHESQQGRPHEVHEIHLLRH